jgi:hypothetical protein
VFRITSDVTPFKIRIYLEILQFFLFFTALCFTWVNLINFSNISQVLIITFLFVFRKVPEIELVKRTALREKFADILTAEEEILQGTSTAFFLITQK